MMQIPRLPADIARCEGREEAHGYYKECCTCMRKLSPPHERQVWFRGWGGHGECPDKIEMESHAQAVHARTLAAKPKT